MNAKTTHCITPSAVLISTAGITGASTVMPIRPSCRAVLTLLISVGRTSAEGSEKSQYRAKVLGGGREIQR